MEIKLRRRQQNLNLVNFLFKDRTYRKTLHESEIAHFKNNWISLEWWCNINSRASFCFNKNNLNEKTTKSNIKNNIFFYNTVQIYRYHVVQGM